MKPINLKLQVPYFKQKKMTCGPSCLQQVLAYYGIKITLDEILKEVKMFKYGTWINYLGIYAAEHKFKVKLICNNVHYIDPSWFKLPRIKLIKKIQTALKKERNKMRKDGFFSLLDYLKTNAEIIFQIPSKKILINCLKKNVPIIICLSSTVLRGRKRFDFKKNKHSEYGEPTGHFVVISGYKNNNFIITDPSVKYGGVHEVPENKLIFSWFSLSGDALIIEPKTKK
jgi:hypothetical protein